MSLFPFVCPELNVNNTFHINTSVVTFGGVGLSAPFFMNTSTIVINAVSGKTTLTSISAKVSNGSTFFNNLNSSGHYFESPTISTLFSYDQVNCVDVGKEYYIFPGRFEVVNSLGFAFSANLTDMWVGSDVSSNVIKLTATKLSVKNADTFISTTGLSINNQSVMNSTTLTVGAALATTVTLKDGSTGSANGMSLFSTTANGVAPATNSSIRDTHVLYADSAWHPPGLIYVASGNLQGTPAAPNVKFAEITWANSYGDIIINGWFGPQNNTQDLHCYLFFGNQWVNTGSDYDQEYYIYGSSDLFGDSRTGGNDAILIEECSNNVNKPVYIKIQIHEIRSGGNIVFQHDCVSALNTTNNLPIAVEGWTTYTSGVALNSNGVTGIRLYFPTGNIAAAQWTVRALPRRI